MPTAWGLEDTAPHIQALCDHPPRTGRGVRSTALPDTTLRPWWPQPTFAVAGRAFLTLPVSAQLGRPLVLTRFPAGSLSNSLKNELCISASVESQYPGARGEAGIQTAAGDEETQSPAPL